METATERREILDLGAGVCYHESCIISHAWWHDAGKIGPETIGHTVPWFPQDAWRTNCEIKLLEKHEPWILYWADDSQNSGLFSMFSQEWDSVSWSKSISFFLLIVSLRLWSVFTMLITVLCLPPANNFITGAEEIDIFCHKQQYQFGLICSPRHQHVCHNCHYQIQLSVTWKHLLYLWIANDKGHCINYYSLVHASKL